MYVKPPTLHDREPPPSSSWGPPIVIVSQTISDATVTPNEEAAKRGRPAVIHLWNPARRDVDGPAPSTAAALAFTCAVAPRSSPTVSGHGGRGFRPRSGRVDDPRGSRQPAHQQFTVGCLARRCCGPDRDRAHHRGVAPAGAARPHADGDWRSRRHRHPERRRGARCGAACRWPGWRPRLAGARGFHQLSRLPSCRPCHAFAGGCRGASRHFPGVPEWPALGHARRRARRAANPTAIARVLEAGWAAESSTMEYTSRLDSRPSSMNRRRPPIGSPSASTTVPSTGTGLIADARGTVSGTCRSKAR